MKGKVTLEYEINYTNLPNYIINIGGNNGASVSLKDISKEELEEYAEKYKQAIIKKHGK